MMFIQIFLKKEDYRIEVNGHFACINEKGKYIFRASEK